MIVLTDKISGKKRALNVDHIIEITEDTTPNSKGGVKIERDSGNISYYEESFDVVLDKIKHEKLN